MGNFNLAVARLQGGEGHRGIGNRGIAILEFSDSARGNCPVGRNKRDKIVGGIKSGGKKSHGVARSQGGIGQFRYSKGIQHNFYRRGIAIEHSNSAGSVSPDSRRTVNRNREASADPTFGRRIIHEGSGNFGKNRLQTATGAPLCAVDIVNEISEAVKSCRKQG